MCSLANTQTRFRPLRFASADGSRTLLLRPSWIDRRPGDPTLELILDPGRAFGTGQHETTRLCVDALVDLSRGTAPRSVLDLGCGSGILALAAARLFPTARIAAVDNDPEATEGVVSKREGEFTCTGCFMIVHPRQFGRKGRLTCPTGDEDCPSISIVAAQLP